MLCVNVQKFYGHMMNSREELEEAAQRFKKALANQEDTLRAEQVRRSHVGPWFLNLGLRQCVEHAVQAGRQRPSRVRVEM